MATLVLERPDAFPSGTVVKVYPASGFRLGQAGEPTAAKVTEATASASKVEFTGLTEGHPYVCWAEVGSRDVYVEVTPEVLTAAGANNQIDSLHKLLGYSFDPLLASGTKILETAGTLHVARVWVPAACTISNIHMWMTTKGGTLTALENGLGLFQEGTRKLLSSVAIAELITAWEGATGEVKLPLITPQAVGAGSVMVGAYFKGTTAPTFAVAPETIGAVNLNVSGNNSRFATGDTGLTTALPNPITSPLVASSQPFLVGVS